MINYRAILEASEKIDQGKWVCKCRNYEHDDEEDDFAGYGVFNKNRKCLVDNGSAWGEYDEVATKEMLEYIALLDPTTVRELIHKAAAYDAVVG